MEILCVWKPNWEAWQKPREYLIFVIRARSVTHKVKIFIVTSLNGITSNPEFDHFQICLQF